MDSPIDRDDSGQKEHELYHIHVDVPSFLMCPPPKGIAGVENRIDSFALFAMKISRHDSRTSPRNHPRGPQSIKRLKPRRVLIHLLLEPDPPHLVQIHMPIKRKMIPILIQCLSFKNPTTPPVPNPLMHLNELTRLQPPLLHPIQRPRTFQTKITRDSRPALAHARRACRVRDIEQLTAAAGLRTGRSPDGETGDDVGGGVVEAGVVGGLGARKWDLGAFALDEGVQGQVGGPVGEEVEGAAVGDEADLLMDEREGEGEGKADRGSRATAHGTDTIHTMASGLTSHHVQSLPLLICSRASCCAKQKTLLACGSGSRPIDSLKGAWKTPPGTWMP